MFEQSPYQPLLNQLRLMTDQEELASLFQPAQEETLSILEMIGVPHGMLDFFRYSDPTQVIRSPELSIEILPLKMVLAANLNSVPGISIVQHSFLTFATCINGDAYCVRCHQRKEEGNSSIYIIRVSGDYETKQKVEEKVIKVTDNFEEFLSRFVAEDLPLDYYFAKE